ncbi:hypothetical protein BLNAU_2889 [Blattamonas nauphoetae]|uniref:Transposase n=1 Tax=Blattamonas nauphoetae TaxID=2049346 RepID=A0ABQ9YEU2_9EUKA|nr:hypothetical protein BLNAU_2889 [Blattamonas nauphoetae]
MAVRRVVLGHGSYSIAKIAKIAALHYDNAKPHTARSTRTFLIDTIFSLISHPAYSQDVSPCDFAIFPILKQRFIGRRLTTIQSLTCAILAEMERISPQQRIRIFQNWI